MEDLSKLMTDMYGEKLSKAVNCSLAGKHKTAIRLFNTIIEQDRRSVVFMEAGFAFDRAGREEKAVEFYNKALKAGVPEKYLPDVYFCLASSYRNIAKIAAARRVLRVAKKNFREHVMFDIMWALTDYDQGRERKALSGLLALIAAHLEQSSLDPYRWFMRREARRIARTPSR